MILAWDLVEKSDRSSAESERMIHAAHAACHHWLEVGDLPNHLRAQCLLATVYAKTNLPETAVRHAERCLSLSTEADDRQTPFDRATTHACAALAYQTAGRMEDFTAKRASALEAIAALAAAKDRTVVQRIYASAL